MGVHPALHAERRTARRPQVRFGYCLLRGGKWGEQQLVPVDYVAKCNKMSPHNPHCPYTLMFEQNSDGHVAGAPRDAFWKSGAGGFALMIVPSLDLVIYKMGGHNGQYDPTLTRLPQPDPDLSRDDWNPFHARRSTKAVWVAMTACAARWRWSAARCGSEA